MRKWDEELMRRNKTPMFYKRFIDDGFGIWEHGQDELMEFLEHANKIHKNIKVELRWDTTNIEFLDTTVKVENGYITTDLYCKPTDKHLYVQQRSNHPNSMTKSIPYGLGIRLKRICSNESDYTSRRRELKNQLRKRGYSGQFIENGLRKVDGLNREDLLKKKVKTNNDRVPIVLTFAKQLPNIAEIIIKNLKILH